MHMKKIQAHHIVSNGLALLLGLLLVCLVSVGVAWSEHPGNTGGGGDNCCAFINITGDSGGIGGGNWSLIKL